MSSSKGKETKQGGGNIQWHRETPRQESAQRRHCVVSFVLVIYSVVLGGTVSNMTIFCFHNTYINKNPKLTYILPLPFHSRATYPS